MLEVDRLEAEAFRETNEVIRSCEWQVFPRYILQVLELDS